MRKFALLLLLFLCNGRIHSQCVDNQDTVLYKEAYDYIVNDSININKEIAVSDSIVDLDRDWFSHHLTDFPIEKKILDQYREKKKFIWLESFYSPCLASIFCKREISKYVLFFSQIEDNRVNVN